MSREVTIYCDESDISGKHFANFYGGALVESRDLSEVIECLETRKAQLNLGAEVKWQKISEAYADKYIALMDTVFDLMGRGKLKMRVMFTQNYFAAANLTPAQRDDSFFKLYYQFVKHAFGLAYATDDGGSLGVRLYFDKLPDTDEKCSSFKGFVLGLNNAPAFRRGRVTILSHQMAEVDSKHHVVLQCLDVVMGSIQFRLNDKHLEKPPGALIRGKRTRAKEKVFKHISARIRQLYPGFNIGVSTGGADTSDRWHHPYRHWLFKPVEVEIRPQFAKQR